MTAAANLSDVIVVPAVSRGLERHPTDTFTAPEWMHVPMFAPGGKVELDKNVAPLVLAFWDAGIPTVFSCEGTPPWEDADVDVLSCDESWVEGIAAAAGVRVGFMHWVGCEGLPATRVFLASENIGVLADAIRAAGPRRSAPSLDVSALGHESERLAALLDRRPLPRAFPNDCPYADYQLGRDVLRVSVPGVYLEPRDVLAVLDALRYLDMLR